MGELSPESLAIIDQDPEGGEGGRLWATQLCRVWDDTDQQDKISHWDRTQLNMCFIAVISDPRNWTNLPGGALAMWPATPDFMGRVLHSLSRQERGPPQADRVGGAM